MTGWTQTLPKLGIAEKLSLVHLYDVKFHTHLIFRRLMNIFEITNIRMTTYWHLSVESALATAQLWILAAFKFGRRVRFALRRKMRKPPITRVPAILNGPTNRPSWKADNIYADIVKRRSTRPWMISVQVNSKFEWRKWPLKSISTCIWTHFCLSSYSVPERWHIFVQ